MIKLAILGTGGMAKSHAAAFGAMRGVKIVACCDLRAELVRSFAEAHSIPAFYTDLEEMLERENPDAVSNVTPDGVHYQTCMQIIPHHIHVLCEKPLASCPEDAWQMARAAEQAGIINMVNFSYRSSAALWKAEKLIRTGELGDIRHIEASYLQGWLTKGVLLGNLDRPSAAWRLCSAAGSRGDLGDIGVHICDMVRVLAGMPHKITCTLANFPKGVESIGGMKPDANDSFAATFSFSNGALGLVHSTRWATGHANSIRIRVWGTLGALDLDLDHSWASLRVCLGEKALQENRWRELPCAKTPDIYTRFIRAVRSGRQDQPDFNAGAELEDILDACLRAAESGRIVELDKN